MKHLTGTICLLLIIFSLFACNQQPKLKGIIGKPNYLAIIKEKDGPYWVIPGEGIIKYKDNQITVKENILIAAGNGEGDIAEIVNMLVNNRETQRGDYQARESSLTETVDGKEITTKVTDCSTGITIKKFTFEIEKVIMIKSGEFKTQ
jgi:hypothetical protein